MKLSKNVRNYLSNATMKVWNPLFGHIRLHFVGKSATLLTAKAYEYCKNRLVKINATPTEIRESAQSASRTRQNTSLSIGRNYSKALTAIRLLARAIVCSYRHESHLSSDIERGVSNPSFLVLWKLSVALKVELWKFSKS